MKVVREALLIAAVILLSMSPSHVPACGPYFMRAMFTFDTLPAMESEQMVAANLGVVQPGYWRRFLVVAYRHLSGVPMTEAEQNAFLGKSAPDASTALRWPEIRKEVSGAGELSYRFNPYRRIPGSEWQNFENCAADAEATANRTLEDRIGMFGADHPGVVRWVQAQDIVFSNCADGEEIPPDPEEDLPEVLRKDRDYQQAAAYFYALKLSEAQVRFQAIAEDEASPWRGIAPYLVARSLIRRATLDPRPDHVDLDMLSRAAHELRLVLEDETRRDHHSDAESLLEYLDARLQPGQRLADAANALSRETADFTEFRGNLTDFQFLMDKGAGTKPGATESEMVDWITTFQARTPESLEHALERWSETSAETWLVAALSKMGRDHGQVEPLLEAAAAVETGSPAWETANYHRVRLLLELGKRDEARDALDAALPVAERRSTLSAVNLFRGQRLGLARDFDDFIAYAEREAVGYDAGVIGIPAEALPDGVPPWQLDSDAVMTLNQGLPLRVLAATAASTKLSTAVRREINLMALARALLLDEKDLAEELAEQASIDLESPADAERRRFLAAYALLTRPGLRPYLVSGSLIRDDLSKIDSLRDNWWCRLDADTQLDRWPMMKRSLAAGWAGEVGSAPTPQISEFLSDADREQFLHEWNRLMALEAGPSYLGRIVIDYARKHPEEPRAAEALHLVVRATRYGCTDEENERYSQQAFALLHRQYPDSDWAEKTPYWFE